MTKDYFNKFLAYYYHTSEENVSVLSRNSLVREIKRSEHLDYITDFLEELLKDEVGLIDYNARNIALIVEYNRRDNLIYFDAFTYVEILSENYTFYVGCMALDLETFSPESFNYQVSLLLEEVIRSHKKIHFLQDEEKVLLYLLDLYMFNEPDASEMCTKLHDYIEARRLARLGRKENK